MDEPCTIREFIATLGDDALYAFECARSKEAGVDCPECFIRVLVVWALDQ